MHFVSKSKQMKKIIFALIIIACGFFTACEDAYEAPSDIYDVSWYTSDRNNKVQYAGEQGGFMAFRDLSQGALSHEWTIDEGMYYLNNGFGKNDSLPKFINKELGRKSSEYTINVYFDKPGVKKVNLRNTFPQKVCFNGETKVEAIKEGDVWVFDTTFVVDVYGEMLPAYEVYKLIEDDAGNVINEELLLQITEEDMPTASDSTNAEIWKTHIIEAGTRIKYVDLTTIDRPTGRTWSVFTKRNQASISTDSAAIFQYKEMGLIQNKLSRFTSERAATNNLIPSATAFKIIPINFEVTPSSKPYRISGTPYESEDEAINVSVSGEIEAIEDAIAAFTVHVTNKNGFNEVIPVASAKVNAEDATLITLKLSDAIYSSDNVTIAFDNTKGSVQSKDGRSLESFSAVEVQSFMDPNIFDEAYSSFEVETITNWKAAFAQGYWVGATNGSETEPVYKLIEAADSPNGTKVMSYTMNGGVTSQVNLQFSKFKTTLTQTGTYLFSITLYIEPGSKLSHLRSVAPVPWVMMNWDLSTQPEGQWITLTEEIEATEIPTANMQLQVIPVENPGAGDVKIYFDNYSIAPLEVR